MYSMQHQSTSFRRSIARFQAGRTGLTTLRLLGITLLGICGAAPVRAAISFAPATAYTVGSQPLAVATKDLNGDNKLDLVVANYTSNTVSILLGNGDGTFQPAKSVSVGTRPAAVAIADLDGDGKMDIAVANYGSNSVTILKGDGQGNFQPLGNPIPVGASPNSLAIGSLHALGKMDIVTANSGEASVSVVLGNGNGTFQAASTVGTLASPTSVALADLNNDNFLDIVTANSGTANVTVLLGTGSGTFGTPVRYATADPHAGGGSSPYTVAVADFNGDHIPDVVTANTFGDISLLQGKGDGTFLSALTSPGGGSYLAVADLNGDGAQDVVVSNGSVGNVGYLGGNGDGSFQRLISAPCGSHPTGLAIGDFNGDGKPDVVVANYNDGTVSVLINTIGNPATHFLVTAPATANAGAPFNVTVTALDLNNASTNNYSGTAHFTSSNLTAALPGNYAFTVADNGSHVFRVTLNSSGNQTVVATDSIVNSITGQATIAVVLPALTTLSLHPSSVLGGVASTGTVTIGTPAPAPNGAIISLASNSASATVGATVTIPAGSTSASFNIATLSVATPIQATISASYAGSTQTAVLTVKPPSRFDLNSDAQDDLIWQYQPNGNLAYTLLNGVTPGSFGYLYQNPPTGWHVVASAHLDGPLDLIWQNATSGDVVYNATNGITPNAGTFAYLFPAGTIDPAWQIVCAADLNADGSPDLIWQNSATADIRYNLMTGVTPVNSFHFLFQNLDKNWKLISAPDLNGDGKADLLFQYQATGDVAYILLNGTTPGAFGYILQNLGDKNWHVVGTPDLNGDGSPDLLWQHAKTGDIAYHFMTGTTLVAFGFLYHGVDTNWKIVGDH